MNNASVFAMGLKRYLLLLYDFLGKGGKDVVAGGLGKRTAGFFGLLLYHDLTEVDFFVARFSLGLQSCWIGAFGYNRTLLKT